VLCDRYMAFELSSLTTLLNVFYIGSFLVLFLYGQRFQLSFMRRGVKSQIAKLDRLRSEAQVKLVDSLKKYRDSTDAATLSQSVDRLLGSFVISPISMDPTGIVPKMEHILDSADENLRSEIRKIAPKADESAVQTLSNVAEITIGLNNMFKIVRHFYIAGSKQGGTYSVVQLQMMMPQIMEMADAYSSAMSAFANGKVIGDGFGPLVASELVKTVDSNSTWTEPIKDTEVAKLNYLNHVAYVVKAKGPGGNVGKPGAVIQKILQEDTGVKFVLTVDASLKLEGEETGSMAEGVGAAIGGPGTDRFRIEETAASRQVEMLAMVTKMSEKEAITELPTQVRDKVPSTVSRILNIVRELPGGASIIIAGIGNTLGVA